MEIGTAIFVVAIVGFMIVSPGFRIVALSCVGLGIAIFLFADHAANERHRQEVIARQAACKNDPFAHIDVELGKGPCAHIENRGH